MTHLNAKRNAYFFVIIAAILWGMIGIYSKKLNELGFDSTHIVFVRAMGASLMLLIFSLVKDKRIPKIKPRDFGYFIGTGILSFSFFNWCYFRAIDMTSLSVAAVLLYTAPSIVMVLSCILFKENISLKKVISLVITFVGCIFVALSTGGTGHIISVGGILAGLGAGIGYALYSIFGRYALKKYDSITVTLYTFLFASVGLLFITDLRSLVSLLSNPIGIVYGLILCLMATVLPFLLYTTGLTYLETSQASIIATLEPIIATIVGVLLFGENVTFYKTLGIILVVFAVVFVRQSKKSLS